MRKTASSALRELREVHDKLAQAIAKKKTSGKWLKGPGASELD